MEELKLIVLKNCEEFGEKVEKELKKIRGERNVRVEIEQARFNNGEGKIIIKDSVRNKDIYVISDIGNHSETYNMFGYENHMGPDEHFQDIKRVISAIKGQASNITVIMPLLYESRQHRRKGRESLDCAIALQELQRLGVKTIITFDVHDPNVQNAIPCLSFENFYPTHIILKEFIKKEKIDFDNLLVVSPDVGAMERALFYAGMLKTNVGMFYKRRDLTKVVNGKNPIIEHNYVGTDVKGKDIIVVDDMIASGGSMIEVADELKKRGANKVYLIGTFSLFTTGVETFCKAHDDGLFDKLYSTNLSYIASEVKNKDWFVNVDCSEFVARVINALNNHDTISPLFDGKNEIIKYIESRKK